MKAVKLCIVGMLFIGLIISVYKTISWQKPNEVELKISTYQANFPKGDIKNTDYVKQIIDHMEAFDQELRTTLISQHLDNQKLTSALQKIDSFHTLRMKEILNEWGWITISKFGADYDQKAWLLVQHADEDPFFQAGVLFILEYLVRYGETSKKNYAYLYDRVAGKFQMLGMLQYYGTQAILTPDKELKLQPYEGTLEEVDNRRREMGLEQPVKEYINTLKEQYHL